MSNVGMIIEERAANIGNFLVGRLLPFKQKRMIGPFIFIDHMGPATLQSGETLDVAPHPHIGLSTLTFLFEGSIMHRDSLGTKLAIEPGAVNWMTAGKGVVHSERTPEYLINETKRLHGLQIWIALPKHLEDIDPSFHHINAEDIPHWKEGDAEYRLIAGTAMNHTSPVPTHSPLYMIEIKANKTSLVDLKGKLYGESGLYILEGNIIDNNIHYEEKNILIAENSELCSFTLTKGSTVYIFGGEPFEEERFIYWNFVSSSAEKIEAAKELWRQQGFEKVPGETDFVPMPEYKTKY